MKMSFFMELMYKCGTCFKSEYGLKFEQKLWPIRLSAHHCHKFDFVHRYARNFTNLGKWVNMKVKHCKVAHTCIVLGIGLVRSYVQSRLLADRVQGRMFSASNRKHRNNGMSLIAS